MSHNHRIDELKLRSLSITDDRGTARIELFISEAGDAILGMNDASGEQFVEIGTEPKGAYVALMNGKDQFATLEISGIERRLVFGDESKKQSTFSVSAGIDEKMPTLMSFGAPNGAADPINIGVWKSSDGEPFVPYIRFLDGTVKSDIFVRKDGIHIRTKNGEKRNVYGVEIEDDGTVRLKKD